jgi:hypothetical protein
VSIVRKKVKEGVILRSLARDMEVFASCKSFKKRYYRGGIGSREFNTRVRKAMLVAFEDLQPDGSPLGQASYHTDRFYQAVVAQQVGLRRKMVVDTVEWWVVSAPHPALFDGHSSFGHFSNVILEMKSNLRHTSEGVQYVEPRSVFIHLYCDYAVLVDHEINE